MDIQKRNIAPTEQKQVRIQNKYSKPIIILRVGGFIILCFLFLFALGYGGYKGVKYLTSKPEHHTTVLEDVRALTLLPIGENPTIATVTDPESLKTQPLFKDAIVGDVVLIFSKAKIVILYRPSEKRIIENVALAD